MIWMNQYTCTAKSTISVNSISLTSLWPKRQWEFYFTMLLLEVSDTKALLHLLTRYFFKLPLFMSSVIIQKGSSTVHTAYSLMRCLCWSSFMIFISVWISGLMTVRKVQSGIKQVYHKYTFFCMEIKTETRLWLSFY